MEHLLLFMTSIVFSAAGHRKRNGKTDFSISDFIEVSMDIEMEAMKLNWRDGFNKEIEFVTLPLKNLENLFN